MNFLALLYKLDKKMILPNQSFTCLLISLKLSIVQCRHRSTRSLELKPLLRLIIFLCHFGELRIAANGQGLAMWRYSVIVHSELSVSKVM